jgi:hypothetical protein
MKTLLSLALALIFGFGNALGQKAPKHDPNPKKDPDIQRGYDQNQKENKEKRQKAKADKAVQEGKKRGDREWLSYVENNRAAQGPKQAKKDDKKDKKGK